MSRIKILSDDIADKIAAGEVIERPVSVVKELLENALDANSSEIKIEIKDGGLKEIKVSDNGEGINQEDLPLAFKRHATSKIQHFDDLYALNSFGFRGEALSSIVSVAQVEIISGTQHNETIKYNPHQNQKETMPSRQGTVISVKNLFYNIPARKKFMQSKGREFTLIYNLVVKYSFAFPKINFSLYHDHEIIYHTNHLETTEDRLLDFYGKELENAIIYTEASDFLPGYTVEAWLVDGTINRPSRREETIFVNNRLVLNQDLQNIVEEAYDTLMEKTRFPIFVLKLHTPSDHLDVNIHPNKEKVKLTQIKNWGDVLLSILQDALWQSNIEKKTPLKFDTNQEYKRYTDDLTVTVTENQLRKEPHVTEPTIPTTESSLKHELKENKNLFFEQNELYENVFSTWNDTKEGSISKNIFSTPITEERVAEEEVPYISVQQENSQDGIISSDNTASSSAAFSSDVIYDVKNIQNLQLIGQLNKTFILAQNPEGLYIIDQHTCHERILFEKYRRLYDESERYQQKLLIPESFTLTAHEAQVLTEHIFLLKELGFLLRYDGDRSFSVLALPQGWIDMPDIAGFFRDLIERLDNKIHTTPADLIDTCITTASCKDAVKANWELSKEDMSYLLSELNNIDNAHSCPHGRPIIYKLSMNELYKIFKRGSFYGK